MISLDVENYCHNCPDFEPVKLVAETPFEIYTCVQCENKEKCEAIAERIKEQLAGNKEA